MRANAAAALLAAAPFAGLVGACQGAGADADAQLGALSDRLARVEARVDALAAERARELAASAERGRPALEALERLRATLSDPAHAVWDRDWRTRRRRTFGCWDEKAGAWQEDPRDRPQDSAALCRRWCKLDPCSYKVREESGLLWGAAGGTGAPEQTELMRRAAEAGVTVGGPLPCLVADVQPQPADGVVLVRCAAGPRDPALLARLPLRPDAPVPAPGAVLTLSGYGRLAWEGGAGPGGAWVADDVAP